MGTGQTEAAHLCVGLLAVLSLVHVLMENNWKPEHYIVIVRYRTAKGSIYMQVQRLRAMKNEFFIRIV